jgi:hypothetical protein
MGYDRRWADGTYWGRVDGANKRRASDTAALYRHLVEEHGLSWFGGVRSLEWLQRHHEQRHALRADFLKGRA